MSRTKLTPTETYTVTHGLHVAAEQFKKNSETCRAGENGEPEVREAILRLADQFDRQVKETLKLIELIESGDYVVVETE